MQADLGRFIYTYRPLGPAAARPQRIALPGSRRRAMVLSLRARRLRPISMNKNEILIACQNRWLPVLEKCAFESQTVAQRIFSTVCAVESDTGGAQYFLNASAETAGFVVEALLAIGVPQTADMCPRPSNSRVFRASRV